MEDKPYYLAGPMSGIPQFNFPAFTEACLNLRGQGWKIISPHELDTDEVKQEAQASNNGVLINGKIGGMTWGDILSKDVKVVADQVKGIVFLPGWHGSRGARLEAMVGLLCNHEFYFYNPDYRTVERMEADQVKMWVI